MPLEVRCSQCRSRLAVPRSRAGKTVKCPVCEAPVVVPAEEGEPPLPTATRKPPPEASRRREKWRIDEPPQTETPVRREEPRPEEKRSPRPPSPPPLPERSQKPSEPESGPPPLPEPPHKPASSAATPKREAPPEPSLPKPPLPSRAKPPTSSETPSRPRPRTESTSAESPGAESARTEVAAATPVESSPPPSLPETSAPAPSDASPQPEWPPESDSEADAGTTIPWWRPLLDESPEAVVAPISHDQQEIGQMLGLGAIFLALFSCLPAGWEIYLYGQHRFAGDPTAGLPTWVVLVLLAALIQAIHGGILWNIHDYATMWVLAVLHVFLTAFYAGFLGIVMFSQEGADVITFGRTVVVENQAILWTLSMTSLNAMIAFFAGRNGVYWHWAQGMASRIGRP